MKDGIPIPIHNTILNHVEHHFKAGIGSREFYPAGRAAQVNIPRTARRDDASSFHSSGFGSLNRSVDIVDRKLSMMRAPEADLLI